MVFKSPWITTPDFFGLPIINVFHKQYEEVEIPPSAFQNYHVAFRKKFTAESGKAYSIRISADDYYKLYINGNFVGQGVKQGVAENYSYNEFDITPFLTSGENSICVHAFYFGLITRAYQTADNRFGIVSDILEDGKVVFGTDKTWKFSRPMEYAGGEPCGYAAGFLENLDFRLEKKGWREKDFDDSNWETAVENPYDDHFFRAKPAKPLYVGKMKPAEVRKISDGHYFIDFGKEITGQFYMEMQGEEGQTVTILCGEELNEDGSVRFDMRCRTKYEERCTLSGEKDVFLFYEYKCFRYVEVKTEKPNLSPETFSAIIRHRPFKNRLKLETDNEMLKKLWALFENTVICGAQESIVDCPHREKGQYLGDWMVSGLGHLYLTGDTDYHKEIMQDFTDSCKVCPGMMGIAPGSIMQELADNSLEFPSILYRYYLHTGDKEGIMPFVPVAERVIAHFDQFVREDGLLDGVSDKWNLVDWPDNLRDGYDFPLTQPPQTEGCHNVINAHYIGALIHLNLLRELFGLPCDYEKENRTKEAFIKVFYDPEKKLFRDAETSNHYSLHANVLAPFYGFQPEEATQSLIAFIEKKGLCCGICVAFFVLRALINMGADELAFRLLLSESEHSFVNMLREGATTTFEAWGKDQKWNTSLCHPWGTFPIALLYDDFNGKFGVKVTKVEE